MPCFQEHGFQGLGQPLMGWGGRAQIVSQASVSPPASGWVWGGGGPTPACVSPAASDPDFVVLDDSLHVRATYISGELVWQAEEARQ